jgi:hypothetical protein
MSDTNTAPEDLGAPQSFLTADGTAVYDRAGDKVGTVAHALADDRDEIFHGLVIETPKGHRYAAANQVDGIFERGVIVAAAADQLPEPAEDAKAEDAKADDDSLADGLRRAWRWLVDPK